MSASAAPRRTRVSTAPSSSLLVTKSLKRATTNANARPSARSFPVFTSISVMHYVAELVRFRSQVAKVVLVGGDHQRDPLHYLEPEGLDPVVLARAVADQADLLNADVRQNLGADPVVALINRESQSLVCLHGVHPLVLELVRPQLVDQADAPPLLAQVQDHARALGCDHLHGAVELLLAVAPEAVEGVAGEALGVGPQQHRLVRSDLPHHQRHMGLAADAVLVAFDREEPELAWQLGLGAQLHPLLPSPPVGDQILAGDDPHAVLLRPFLDCA